MPQPSSLTLGSIDLSLQNLPMMVLFNTQGIDLTNCLQSELDRLSNFFIISHLLILHNIKMSFLSGRKFLIVGGNGFVGNRIAATLIQHSAQVSILSRKGPRYEYPENKKVNWIIGDALQHPLSEPVKKQLNESDTIIHSVGTLIDSSIKKLRKPQQPGTYEQVNRDTFINILSHLSTPKTIFYLSSSHSIPFIPRYLSTKRQCEQKLLSAPPFHNGYVIRPGMIYDWKLKKFTLPLRYAIKGWAKLYPYVYSIAAPGTMLQHFIQQFQQGEPTSLDSIANTVAYVSYKGNAGRILENKDLLEIDDSYRKLCREEERKME